jgi:hypothetical protein
VGPPGVAFLGGIGGRAIAAEEFGNAVVLTGGLRFPFWRD